MDSLDIALWVATAVVIVGVALESIEDVHQVWEKYVWHEREPWSPVIPKVGLILLVLGLAFELKFQTAIGIRESKFRVDAANNIAHAEDRASDANVRAAKAIERAALAERDAANAKLEEKKFERMLGGREIIKDAAFQKLGEFAGTPFCLRQIRPPLSAEKDVFTIRQWEESVEFLESLVQLQIKPKPDWKPLPLFPQQAVAGPDIFGVHIYSDGFGPNPSSSEKQAYKAAEALVLYLQNDLGLWTTRHDPRDIEYEKLSPDTVIICVGINDPQEEMRRKIEHEREQELWLRLHPRESP